MQLCGYSDDCNVCLDELPSFLSWFPAKPEFPFWNSFPAFEKTMFLKPFFLWLRMRSEPTFITADHMEISNVDAQQGLAAVLEDFQDGENFWCPTGLSKKKNVCNDGEIHTSLGWDNARSRCYLRCEWHSMSQNCCKSSVFWMSCSYVQGMPLKPGFYWHIPHGFIKKF